MTSTQEIRFRVTVKEKNHIKEMARLSGFVNISEYIRCTLFNRVPSIEQKLNDIKQLLRKLIEAI